MKFKELFRRFAVKVSNATGTPWAFFIALFLIILWAVSGPIFEFSNRWQLVVNTGTTIVTLLMVFLIQNTQNRDSKAVHIKLDELLRKQRGEHFVNLEEMPDEDIEKNKKRFRDLHDKYEKTLKDRRKKTKVASKK